MGNFADKSEHLLNATPTRKTQLQQQLLDCNHSTVWAAILEDETWAQNIREQRLDVVLLTRDFDRLFKRMPSFEPEAAGGENFSRGTKPYLTMSITGGSPSGKQRSYGLDSKVNPYTKDLITSLRSKKVDIARMEVEIPAFTLNIMGAVGPDRHIEVPVESKMLRTDTMQALFYSASEKIHSIEAFGSFSHCIIHGSKMLDEHSFVPPNSYQQDLRSKNSALRDILQERRMTEQVL